MTNQRSTLNQFKESDKEGRHTSYEKYKDTDYEQFGRIPDEWGILKLKQISDIFPSNVDKKEKEGESSIYLCNYTDIYHNTEITPSIDFMEATAKTSDIQRFRLEEGDVIITKDSESWDDIGVPSYVAKTMDDVICGYHLTQLKPDERIINGKYLYYFLESDIGSHHFHTEANGVTRYGISKNGISQAPVILPPKEEQKAIVKFVDQETKRVANLVKEKELLVDLLKEKKKAIINDTITGGLNTSSNKKTNVDWLDSIPANWENMKLKWASNFITDGSHHSPSEDPNGDKIYITVSDLIDGEINFDEAKRISNEDYRELEKGDCRPQKGDVLFSKDGTIGKVTVVEDNDFVVLSSLAIIRPGDNVSSEYLKYFFESEYSLEQMRSRLKGSALTRITLEIIVELDILVPPREEQKEIVSYLNDKTSEIEDLIAKVEKGIERLKEYRTVLITEAVTGQIDVRGEV